MKPQQPNVEYCIEHKDWINGLWERRGLQFGDWAGADGQAHLLHRINTITREFVTESGDYSFGELTWLPSVDDVLAMLETMAPEHGLKLRNMYPIDNSPDDYEATMYTRNGLRSSRHYGTTWLIALMELLKLCDFTAS